MVLTLKLSPEEEARLRSKAAKAGLNEEAYVRSLIAGKHTHRKATTTPAKLVADWQAKGLLTGYGDPEKDSTEVARELREQFSRREHPV